MNRIEVRNRMKEAVASRWTKRPSRSPSLKELAEYIKLFLAKPLGISVFLRESSSSTDRPLKGTRLRIPGRGRRGKRLEIIRYKSTGFDVVFEHDSSETYRHNCEVCQWILDKEQALPVTEI